MDPLTVLDSIRIAAPCPASWAEMAGDDRARFCQSCSKHVYNLAELTPAEAVALIEEHEGDLCTRLYRRRDGTVLTADCPVGLRARAFRRVRRVAVGGLVGVSVLLTGALIRARGSSGSGWDFEPPPTGPGVTLADWKDWALETVGILPRRRPVTMGAMLVAPDTTNGQPDPLADGSDEPPPCPAAPDGN